MLDSSIHTDCGKDLNNNEVCVVGRIPDTGGGISGVGACPTWTGTQDGGVDIIDMTTHKAQCLVDINWADTEVGFRDGNAGAGWVLITFFKAGNCNTYSCFDTTNPTHLDPAWATNWVHFAEEGLLVRIDNNNGASNKYRLFHTRSRSSEYYWAIPRGSINRDGQYVVFDSNFDISNTGLANHTDVYLSKVH